MLKKSFVTVLAVLMLLTVLPVVPVAATDNADYVAMIGDTGYTTLSAALAAIPEDGTLTEVVLLKDAEMTAQWTPAAGENIILDLGGHTLTTNQTSATAICVKGKLAIKNGTVYDPVDRGEYTFQVRGTTASPSTLEFLPGLMVTTVQAVGGTVQSGSNVSGETGLCGTFIMNDGVTVNTSNNLLYAYNTGAMVINGGVGRNDVVARLFKVCRGNSYTAPRIIKGGTFTTAAGTLFADVANLTIVGGTFSEQPQASVIPDGCEAVAGEDGTYTVMANSGALVGDTYYSTLDAVKNAIPTDDTETAVTLLADVELSATWTIGANQKVILDLGGHTLNITLDPTKTNTHGFVVTGDLAVKNGTITDLGSRSNCYTFSVKGSATDAATLEFVSDLTVMSNTSSGAVTLGAGKVTSHTSTFIMNDTVTVNTALNLVYSYGDGSVIINGGVGQNDVASRLFKLLARGADNTAPRVIYGGTFTSVGTGNVFDQTSGMIVVGGSFHRIPSAGDAIIPEGYTAVPGDDGYYTVTRDTADVTATVTGKHTVIEFDAALASKLHTTVYEALVTAERADGKAVELLSADLFTGGVYYKNADGESIPLYYQDGTALTLGSDALAMAVVYNDIDATARFYANGKNLYYYEDGFLTVAAELALSVSAADSMADGLLVDATAVSATSSYNLGQSGTAEMVGFQQSEGKTQLRLLASIDTLYYGAAGFRVELLAEDGETVVGTQTMMGKSVFTSVTAADSTVTAESEGAGYLVAGLVLGVPADETHFLRVTPFTLVADGCETVWGEAVTYTVDPLA